MVVVPSPSWPVEFEPVAQSVPFVVTKNVLLIPAATEATPLANCTGVLRLVVVPSPNCPLLFKPVAQSVPSVFTKSV